MQLARLRFAPHGMMAIKPEAWGFESDARGPETDRGYTEVGDAAVVDIRGPLMKRAEGFWAYFFDDYDRIAARARAAFGSTCKRVLLRIDSPGGEAAGCFELARELRAMAEASGKELVAYADGLCASAAYALATSASRIEACPTAYVGSIGVFEARVDWTAMTAAQGVKIAMFSSGEEKLDRNPDVAITDEAGARIQAQVDQFAGLFFQLCSELRGGAPEDYRKLRGGIFLGEAALGVGLVDAVTGWAEAVAGTSGTSTEKTMGDSKKSFDAAKDALRAVVDDEKCSEEEREKARKSLRSLEAEPEKKDDGDGEKKDGEKDAKAAEPEKKDGDEAKAMALAGNSVELARQVMSLTAQLDAERTAKARADLFAKRPDFTAEVRATLETVPLATVKEAVEKWPRASASPTAAAAALTAGGGEQPVKAEYVPKLTAAEKELLRKAEGRLPTQKAATQQGSTLVMPSSISQADAAARLKELDAELANEDAG